MAISVVVMFAATARFTSSLQHIVTVGGRVYFPPTVKVVKSVEQSNPAKVTVHEHTPHNLEDGDKVFFTGMGGKMERLNGRPYAVKVTGPSSFDIPDLDTTDMGPYVEGGVISPHRESRQVSGAVKPCEGDCA